MYWPNGIPRVYAVNGPGTQLPEVDEDGKSLHDRSKSHEEHEEDTQTREGDVETGSKEEVWGNEALNGLCVSRSGHLFATMTKSSLAIWQTRVRFFPFAASIIN
jgi:hypothetical protein